MLTKILHRGWPACRYLLTRFLLGVSLLAILPLSVLLGWVSPDVTAALVRLANREQREASKYLGLLPEPALPSAAPRGMGNVVALFRDKAFRRSLRILLLPVVVIPELIVVVVALVAVPAALGSMVLWPLDPGNFNLMAVPIDSWWKSLLFGPLQILTGIGLLGWGVPAVAARHAKAVRGLLAPTSGELETARLAERVEELTRTRAGAVDSHGAELRRIERDLHDGTQAQLVSLAMRIGIAKQTMAEDPEKAAKLLDDARDGAEQAMTELRGVLRTMYPPILADRGLAGAVSALSARCPISVELRVGDLGTVPASVEAAAYFVVAESLTNVTKHSAAGHVDLLLERRGPELYLAITDDGIGGARINEQPDLLGRGSGLHGMVHRVEAIDGHLELQSPIGGPTTVEVILPCE
ncbi:sensor histidine kinase [Kribbella sancticallisti]|uniref:histidine kinase n=1 Tax=Kribbella sancticallisti TaxID=460087 RepID=A0ABP4PA09_9ACTN